MHRIHSTRRPTTLLLVRHGESEDNVAGRLSGGRDVPLTATGRRQARRLAAHLATEFTIDAVYTSPLSRAMETARCIGREVGLEPIPLDGLREWALGRLEGCRSSASRSRAIATVVRQAGGETRAAFRTRVLHAMERIVGSHPGKTVAVVTHGGPLAAFLATTLQGNAGEWATFKMDNAALTIVTIDKTGVTLHRFNKCAPRRPAGSMRPRTPIRGG